MAEIQLYCNISFSLYLYSFYIFNPVFLVKYIDFVYNKN